MVYWRFGFFIGFRVVRVIICLFNCLYNVGYVFRLDKDGLLYLLGWFGRERLLVFRRVSFGFYIEVFFSVRSMDVVER